MDNYLAVLESIKAYTASFTGHRTYNGETDDELRLLIRHLYERGITRYLCGMSWGFDLMAGRLVAEFKQEYPHVELVAVEPFEGFRDLFSGEDGRLYDAVLAAADERVIVGEDSKGVYMLRNDYLVDNASLMVAWYNNIPRGGTAYTVRRARKRRVEIVNLYPDPQLDLEFNT